MVESNEKKIKKKNEKKNIVFWFSLFVFVTMCWLTLSILILFKNKFDILVPHKKLHKKTWMKNKIEMFIFVKNTLFWASKCQKQWKMMFFVVCYKYMQFSSTFFSVMYLYWLNTLFCFFLFVFMQNWLRKISTKQNDRKKMEILILFCVLLFAWDIHDFSFL